MPEPSNETLAIWLGDVVVTELGADAIKGYQAVLAQAAKGNPGELLDLVALAHRAAPEKTAWFAELAHEKQPAVPLTGNDGIVARLAAAATVRTLTSGGQSRVIAGLAAQSAAFLGLSPDLPEVPTFAETTIVEAGDAARVRALKLDPIAPKVTDWVTAGFPQAAEGQPEPEQDEWELPIREVAKTLDALAADIHDRLGLLDEEYNVLWWSHAARSTIADDLWSNVDPPARRAALVAYELGQKITRTPAPRMVDGLTAVALGDAAAKSIAVADVVIAARDAGVPVAGVEHTLLPISTAVTQARIYTEDDTWITVLDKVHGVNVKDKRPATAIARQIIREQQLGKLL